LSRLLKLTLSLIFPTISLDHAIYTFNLEPPLRLLTCTKIPTIAATTPKAPITVPTISGVPKSLPFAVSGGPLASGEIVDSDEDRPVVTDPSMWTSVSPGLTVGLDIGFGCEVSASVLFRVSVAGLLSGIE